MAQDTPQDLRGKSIYQVFVRSWSEEGTFDAALPALAAAHRLGFDIVYLTPVHPVGKAARKGTKGSPYAIADYRAVDPALGGEEGFGRYIEAAHSLGLKIIMDVVYNHTSPDSVLAREHPDWFWKDASGMPAPRVAEWTDVVDLDYANRALWEYQIETLEQWARFGVDGFRCDVASLVPVPFWVEARKRLAAIKPCLWLAESVHKEFVIQMRLLGISAACDAELHQAFDLSYDYDGRSELEAAWAGTGTLAAYLHHLFLQDCMMPATAIKARFLENHDQVRAASRFCGARLRAWTAFTMLLDGAFLAYMGQERAVSRRPNLFEQDPIDWNSGCALKGNEDFAQWFDRAHHVTKAIRAREPRFSVTELSAGVVLVERRGGPKPVSAIINLFGHTGRLFLASPLEGLELLSGNTVSLNGSVESSLEPIIIECR